MLFIEQFVFLPSPEFDGVQAQRPESLMRTWPVDCDETLKQWPNFNEPARHFVWHVAGQITKRNFYQPSWPAAKDAWFRSHEKPQAAEPSSTHAAP